MTRKSFKFSNLIWIPNFFIAAIFSRTFHFPQNFSCSNPSQTFSLISTSQQPSKFKFSLLQISKLNLCENRNFSANIKIMSCDKGAQVVSLYFFENGVVCAPERVRKRRCELDKVICRKGKFFVYRGKKWVWGRGVCREMTSHWITKFISIKIRKKR